MNDIYSSNDSYIVAYKSPNVSLVDYETELKKRFGLDYLRAVYPLDTLAAGVVVFAKTEASFAKLQELYQSGGFEFTFYAVVVGENKVNDGVFSGFVAQDSKSSRLARVPQLSKDAVYVVAKYKVLARVKQIALLSIEVNHIFDESIRFVCFDVGTPIFGDKAFGGDSLAKNTNLSLVLSKVRFKNPNSDDYLNFVAMPSEGKPWSYFDVEKFLKIH